MHFTHDARVIQTHLLVNADLQVLAQRQEVMFRDGTAVQLHLVRLHPQREPDTFTRALQLEGLRWLAVDLRKTLAGARATEFELDVLRLAPRDTPGMVFYTLRSAFATAPQFIASAQACAFACWWHREEVAV